MEIEIPTNHNVLLVELIRKWQGVSSIANDHTPGHYWLKCWKIQGLESCSLFMCHIPSKFGKILSIFSAKSPVT